MADVRGQFRDWVDEYTAAYGEAYELISGATADVSDIVCYAGCPICFGGDGGVLALVLAPHPLDMAATCPEAGADGEDDTGAAWRVETDLNTAGACAVVCLVVCALECAPIFSEGAHAHSPPLHPPVFSPYMVAALWAKAGGRVVVQVDGSPYHVYNAKRSEWHPSLEGLRGTAVKVLVVAKDFTMAGLAAGVAAVAPGHAMAGRANYHAALAREAQMMMALADAGREAGWPSVVNLCLLSDAQALDADAFDDVAGAASPEAFLEGGDLVERLGVAAFDSGAESEAVWGVVMMEAASFSAP